MCNWSVTSLLFGALVLSAQSVGAQESVSYKVLATNKTSTMQKELQEAGEGGFRFVAAMGGETAMGGNEVVVLLERVENDAARYEYRVLATSRTSTLQKELQQAADAGWLAVGQTVFESMFGGKETAAILERNSEQPSRLRYEYKLIATSKTSTLAKELQEATEQGYRAVGLTVGKTAVGGNELVAVTRRPTK